jgi:hypothetical protein
LRFKLLVVVKVPNRILTTETYHTEIQARLGVGADILPNADIDAISVLPIAEARMIKAVPNYADLDGDDANYLYAATICLVAATLASSMPARIKKSKKDFDYSIENQAVNWASRAIELVDEAYSLIDLISTQASSDAPVFGVAGPTRANASLHYPFIVHGDHYV